MRIRIATALCLGLVAAQASAAEDSFFNPAIVGGVSVGQLTLDNSAYQSPTGLQGFSANGTAWTAFVGFELNKYFSAEVGRFNGGTPSQMTLISSTATLDVYDISDVKNNGWVASALAAYPITELFSVYGRAGMYRWSSSIKVTRQDDFFVLSGTPPAAVVRVYDGSTFLRTQTSTITGNDVILGLGIGLNVDSGQIRLEYSKTEVNNFDARFISLIASWRFRPWQ